MSIEKILVGTTAHVAAETARQLEAKCGQRQLIAEPLKRPWVDLLTVYPHGEYGWLINVVGIIDDHTTRAWLPCEFLALLDQCQADQCDWLLLDRDADVIADDLPLYDW